MQLIKTRSYLENIIDVPISRGSMSHQIHRESSALWKCVFVCAKVLAIVERGTKTTLEKRHHCK